AAKAVWYVGYTPELVAASTIAGLNSKGQPTALPGTTLRGTTISFGQAGGSSLAGPQWKAAMGPIAENLTPAKFDATTLQVYQAPKRARGDDDRGGRSRGRDDDD